MTNLTFYIIWSLYSDLEKKPGRMDKQTVRQTNVKTPDRPLAEDQFFAHGGQNM